MLIDDVERYLAIRCTLGFQLINTGSRLRAYARYAASQGEAHVRAPTAVMWASTAPSPHARHAWFHDLQRFAQFMHAEDQRHDRLVGDPFPSNWHRPLPYIYSPDELARLVAAAARLKPTWPHRRLVISTIIGLIASTGLRVSEALGLELGDVHPDGYLVVRMTKFRKSRLVPLHPSVQAVVNGYLAERAGFAGSDEHLFVSQSGRALPYRTLYTGFHQALVAAGIGPTHRRRPRIHDLRHTFATRALQSCSGDIGRHHLALSTYLGHTCVHGTYWYLEATPELMSGSSAAAEALAWEVRP